MKNEALRQCELHDLSFGSTFRYQYVIAPERLNLPDLEVVRVGSQFVHIGSALKKTPITDLGGKDIGIMLGVAADHEGNEPANVIATIIDGRDPAGFEIFEEYLTIISGRFAFILNIGGQTRFYADAVGMIGAVYAQETKRLASSPLLTIDREIRPHPDYDLKLIRKGQGGYGLNHTADEAIFRLNANHFMDLDAFTHQRFWPFENDKFEASDDEYYDIFDEIITAMRNITAGLATRQHTAMPISGGRDSRILFALAGDEGREKITQYYTHITNYASRRDSAVAAMLVGSKGFKHEIHDKKRLHRYKKFVKEASLVWRVGSGTEMPVPMEVQTGMLRYVKRDAVVMRGHQTNIMRGQYFNFRNPKDTHKLAWQYRMFNLASVDSNAKQGYQRFLGDLEAFHYDLPKNVGDRTPDFIFYEALVPSALGVLFQGVNHVFYISPFNSRRLVQLSMQFSVDYKIGNYATNDTLLRAEPDMLGIPFGPDLTAELNETEENWNHRKQRVENAQARYEELFGFDAPEVEIKPMDLSYYHEIIGWKEPEE